MKALSLWQPWASLVAIGEKRYETRGWTTNYRGPLAIHATAKLPPLWLGASRHLFAFHTEVADVFNLRLNSVESKIRSLPMGCVLCIARLESVEPVEAVREILCQREKIFGNYEDGRYAWGLEVVKLFDVPIPAKGNRMLWNWNV